MKWSKAKQRMALKLQEIERARKQVAEARLLDARIAADDATQAKDQAAGQLADADASWRRHLGSPGFDLALGQALGAELLLSQRELETRQADETRDHARLDSAVERWRHVETAVRVGDQHLSRGRREVAKRAEASREQGLAERTTWKWFSR